MFRNREGLLPSPGRSSHPPGGRSRCGILTCVVSTEGTTLQIVSEVPVSAARLRGIRVDEEYDASDRLRGSGSAAKVGGVHGVDGRCDAPSDRLLSSGSAAAAAGVHGTDGGYIRRFRPSPRL